MRLGVVIPPTRPWRDLVADFAWAEEVGYDVGYVYDHLTHPTAAGGWLAEGFSVLAAVAATTSRMEVGTLVASATLHSPVALARLAATTDDIAGGRLVLGLGAGSPRCAQADRAEWPTPGEMHRRLVDVVEGFAAVFDGATEWKGSTRSFAGLETTAVPPGGRTSPYLMLAAHGPKSIELAVRHADAWNTYGGPASVELAPGDYWAEVERQAARVTEACDRLDRDPTTLRRTLLLGYGTVRPTVTAAAYLEAVERAEAAGFAEVVVYGPFGDPRDRFRSEPGVHAEAIGRVRS
jgi:alkanesulfonate monooxygenase SsuD/methylene tetrahydromethanopterin reductase-like flavin-dependent oxidoreductase (luciferase family)